MLPLIQKVNYTESSRALGVSNLSVQSYTRSTATSACQDIRPTMPRPLPEPGLRLLDQHRDDFRSRMIGQEWARLADCIKGL